jgi:hypothetical protein
MAAFILFPCPECLYSRIQTSTSSTAASKKRKTAPDSDVATTANEGNHRDHSTASYLAISVPDIEPAIFGFFLTYMYTGSYPSAVDDSIFSAWTPNILTSMSDSNPHCPEVKPPNAHPNLVPASISAWPLAYRLGAPSFTNHAMHRIYKGLGLYFTLTPDVTEYIWRTTMAEAPAHLAGLDRNPLRKFIIDILTTYWAVPATARAGGEVLGIKQEPVDCVDCTAEAKAKDVTECCDYGCSAEKELRCFP